MGQIYTTQLNREQGFYLFMRGRAERDNNANPGKEIRLPCVWSGSLSTKQLLTSCEQTDQRQRAEAPRVDGFQ